MSSVLRFPDTLRGKAPSTHFTRAELNLLLNVYTKRVMTGEWRDYAISFNPGMASFFIFRHSLENPLFVISKLDVRGKANRAARNGRFLVTSRQQKLKQGHDLEDVLAIFDHPLKLVTG
jgi:hypothetical protein